MPKNKPTKKSGMRLRLLVGALIAKCTTLGTSVTGSSRIQKTIAHVLNSLMYLAYLFLFTAIAFAIVVFSQEAHQAYLMHKVGKQVVLIVHPEGHAGTGFYVQAPSGLVYIVTNKHVCGNSKPGEIVGVSDDNSRRIIPRRVLETSQLGDVCIIEGLPGHEGLTLGSAAEVGDSVYSLGHPLAGPLDFQHGYIKQRTFYEGEAIFLTNLYIFPGSSGSPVFDKYGNVVGIIAMYQEQTKWGIGVDLSLIVELLRAY